MFKLVLVDWADRQETREYGMDIAEALKEAVVWSKWGNTDYLIVFENNSPRLKYIDGEVQSV